MASYEANIQKMGSYWRKWQVTSLFWCYLEFATNKKKDTPLGSFGLSENESNQHARPSNTCQKNALILWKICYFAQKNIKKLKKLAKKLPFLHFSGLLGVNSKFQ